MTRRFCVCVRTAYYLADDAWEFDGTDDEARAEGARLVATEKYATVDITPWDGDEDDAVFAWSNR